MKLFKNILLPAVALVSVASFTACEEKDTLDGANVVYIDMEPAEYTLVYGDTVKINAKVTNESGRTINTPITWSVDDENVAVLVGDSAITSIEGAAGKTTKIRATLKNGKYGLATVSVVKGLPGNVVPVDSIGGEQLMAKRSYSILRDSVIFTVAPKTLLYDYTPTYEIEGDGLNALEMTVDKENSTATVYYSADRVAGNGKLTLRVGEGNNAKEGSVKIEMVPPMDGSTFYGPDYANMPYIGTRPTKGTLAANYFTHTYTRVLNINSTDTCRVAVNVTTGAMEDIREALKTYEWVPVSGNSVLVSAMYDEIVEDNGFDAVIVVKSGINSGEAVYEMRNPIDTCVATFIVYDYKKDFPVEEIILPSDTLYLISGKTEIVKVGIVPMSSFAYHKPRPVVADPAKVEIGEYEGDLLPIRGGEPGETNITFYSNEATRIMHVVVKEGVKSVLWSTGNKKNIFAGETTVWGAEVVTPSGMANTYATEWSSSDANVAAVELAAGTLDKGSIKGIAPGTAKIQASCLDKKSDEVEINVVASPVNLAFPENGTYGVFVMDGQLTVDLDLTVGGVYSNGTILLTNVTGEDVIGTFTASEGSALTLDGAVAAISAASLTISATGEESDGYEIVTISGTLTLSIEGMDPVTITLNNLKVQNWN